MKTVTLRCWILKKSCPIYGSSRAHRFGRFPVFRDSGDWKGYKRASGREEPVIIFFTELLWLIASVKSAIRWFSNRWALEVKMVQLFLKIRHLSLTVFAKLWDQISRSWNKILIFGQNLKKAEIFLCKMWLWCLLTWNFDFSVDIPTLPSRD